MPFASGLVVVVVARVTLGSSRLSNSISLRVGLDNIMFVLLLTVSWFSLSTANFAYFSCLGFPSRNEGKHHVQPCSAIAKLLYLISIARPTS